MLLDVTSIAQANYRSHSLISPKMDKGIEKRNWQYILCHHVQMAYRNLVMIRRGGSSYTLEAQLSSLGVFSLIIGVAFILPAKRRSNEEEHQEGAITSPISWPQTKASRQAACWRWCVSDQRASSCQQLGLVQQPDCSWIDLSLWSEQALTAGTVYAKKRQKSEIYSVLCGNRCWVGEMTLALGYVGSHKNTRWYLNIAKKKKETFCATCY